VPVGLDYLTERGMVEYLAADPPTRPVSRPYRFARALALVLTRRR
jgi:hypothetical protein